MRGRTLIAFVSAGLLSTFAARAEPSSGFTLETGSPDALCPALEVTREAVTRRLGALVVEGHKGWRARYTIGHAPSGSPRDFVRLELFSPEGRVELVRDLPIAGESCRTMADVVALVLDRYFRGLAAEASPRAERDAWPAERGQPPELPPAVRAPAAEPRPPLSRRLSLEYAVAHPVALPWVGLRGSATLSSRLELSLALRGALVPWQERASRGATVEARAWTARLGLAWRVALPPGLVHVGPLVSLALEQARTEGLAAPTERMRARWSGGVEGGFVTPIGRAIFLQAALAAELRVTSGHFFIEEREVLASPALTLGWSLGIGYY